MESLGYFDFTRCILNVTYAVLFFFNQHICIGSYILFNLEFMRKLRYPLNIMQGRAWIFFKIILRGAKVRKRVWELLLGREMSAQLPDSGWNPAFPATSCLNLGRSSRPGSLSVCE